MVFTVLGHVVTRHPWRVLIVGVVLIIAALMCMSWGFGKGALFERLTNPVSLVEGSESDTVYKQTSTDSNGPVIIGLVDGVAIPQDVPALIGYMTDHRPDFTQISGVASVRDPFQAADPANPQPPDLTDPSVQMLLSTKQDGFVMIISLTSDLGADAQKTAEDAVNDALDSLQQDLRTQFADAQVRVISNTSMNNAVMVQIQSDMVHGESIGLPIAFILLIIVFGGVLFAGMPVLAALAAIGTGMGMLWAVTFATDVPGFTTNVASVIGVSLSVDYGLIMVSRYREEIGKILVRDGYTTDGSHVPKRPAARPIVREAMEITIATAGRTIIFSALTTALALTALLPMKAAMLRVIGITGIIVVLLALLAAVTLVPSIVVLLGPRLVRPSIIAFLPGLRRLIASVADTSSDHGFFSKLAHWVHRRPWPIMIIVILILVAMASPLSNLQLRTDTNDYLPKGMPATEAYNTLQENYPAMESSSIIVIADQTPDGTAALFQHLQALQDVDYVSQPAPLASDTSRTVINVHIDAENQVGPEITGMVKDLRAYDAGYDLMVGGPAALQYDFIQSIVDRAPIGITILVLAVFLLMYLMTGSIIVPLKTMIINALSLVASLGVTSYIFMHGYLGMPKVMGIETFILVCGVCFGFGLAMDYEVFLVARIKEFWNAGYSNDEAVERGLQRSGRIITSAGAIIVAVFIGFTFGQMVPIKQIGVILAVMVVTDVTLVRMLLVPATMTILGKWNWWPHSNRRDGIVVPADNDSVTDDETEKALSPETVSS